ncbi:hypothetical protein SAMN03159428_04894 [Kosakonia radicincitans]|uniref:Uncharacterized protein n=1 Tax=Kosakonia radicincitans TaxID=283686 RepID=A0AAX2EZ53_9ENTR|nr:hypothetical protein [Kosakonia radicincitans]SFF37676.1 hypothetical protein SAMN03159468_04921 [Kosakonia radicincitans]SFR26163.1 hypothetical protein SAMN03159514_04881 [Kosakonia radicincitans]SFU16634.1 hypothetical protein SAMN03159428_04894 [Kosakonia radicincitans]SFY31811.1 hypothetical protein SAMN03159436_04871 [Kosakonia radicincitans]
MKTQPEHRWPVFASFLRLAAGRLRSVSRWSLLTATLEGAGLVIIVWSALKHYLQPVTEQAQMAFNALLLTGVLTVLYYASKPSPGFGHRLRVALYGHIALLVVLVLLGNFGDVAIAQPGYLGLFLAGVLGINMVASTCRLVRRQNDAQPEVWRYGIPVYEEPDEKLTDISTATWLWQQSGIICTHRMLENLEKALQRVGYELTQERESNTNILSGPAQMRPHLRKQVEAELLRARELYWAPDQSQEMVEDTIRMSQKSGFARKMLEDILYDLRKRGWGLRAIKSDRELERWPLQQVVIRLSAQPGTRLTDIIRCLRRITGYVRDNELPPDTQNITHTGEFPRYESENDPWAIRWEIFRRQCDAMPGFFPRNDAPCLPPYFDDGMNEFRISLAIHMVLIVQGTRSTRPEFLAADIERAISSIETGYQQGAIFNDDSGYAFCCQGRPFT